MDIFRQDQVMSGSHGTISIDGEILAEVFEWSAKVKIDRKKINMAGGQTGEKITGTSGEGTIKRYKANTIRFFMRNSSDLVQKMCKFRDELKNG